MRSESRRGGTSDADGERSFAGDRKPVPITSDAAAEQDEPALAEPLRSEAEAEAEAEAERELDESLELTLAAPALRSPAIRSTLVPLQSEPRVRPPVELAPGVREQRAADALGLMAQSALAELSQGGGQACGREGRFEVVLHVDAEVLAAEAAVGRCELDNGPRISAETIRRLSCSSPTVTLPYGEDGELLGPGRRSRRISAPLWRALRSRDQRCVWPGCEARHGLVVHHVEPWARGGATELSNLVCVCRSHHWALHEGGFRVQGRAPGGLVFFAPDGHELARSPAACAGDALELVRHNQELGLTIDAETGLTLWQGEAMDYDWAVANLLQRPPSR